MTARSFFICALLGLGFVPAPSTWAQADKPRAKIVLIAGKKSHGPVGNGIHDYGWSVRLLKVMLDKEASDLHITAGTAPQLRIDGHLLPLKTDEPMNAAHSAVARSACG